MAICGPWGGGGGAVRPLAPHWLQPWIICMCDRLLPSQLVSYNPASRLKNNLNWCQRKDFESNSKETLVIDNTKTDFTSCLGTMSEADVGYHFSETSPISRPKQHIHRFYYMVKFIHI